MIEEFCVHLAAKGIAPSTIDLRRAHLTRMSRHLPGGLLAATVADLELILASAGSNEYRRSLRSTMRTFFGWAVRAKLLAESPAADLERVKPSPPSPQPAGDRVYQAALLAADEREHLMLRLAAENGLRRGEIAQVHDHDVMEDLLGDCLLVHGKGGKDRVVPLTDDLGRELRAFQSGGWLFPNGLGGHLTAAHVGVLLRRILPAGVTPHKFRHRFATLTYTRTNDLFAVQQLLGHSSPATTQRYVGLDTARLRQVSLAAA